MEIIRSSIESMSVGEKDLATLHRTLNATDAQEVLKESSIETLDETIRQLNISQHSLGILHLLACKAKSFQRLLSNVEIVDAGSPLFSQSVTYIDQVVKFLMSFQIKQVHLAHSQFVCVCKIFTKIGVAVNQSIRTVGPLKRALLESRLTKSSLTPIHSCLVLACLHSKCYFAAIDILDSDVYEIDAKPLFMETLDILTYYYYGGMIYIGLKKFQEASNFFLMVITAPSSVVSEVVIQAYCKYLMVYYIVNGEEPILPKFTSSVVQRHIRGYSLEYHELMKAFKSLDKANVHSSMSKHSDAFKASGNYGLVKQAVEAFTRKKIKNLTLTYVTLSLDDIAHVASLDCSEKAEQYILSMINADEISARIEKDNGTVTFYGKSASFVSSTLLKRIHEEIQNIVDFSQTLQSANDELTLDPLFIQKVGQRDRKLVKSSGLGSPTSWNSDRSREGFFPGDSTGDQIRL